MMYFFSLSIGHPALGTCKMKLEVRLPDKLIDPNVTYTWPTIERETRYVSLIIVLDLHDMLYYFQ